MTSDPSQPRPAPAQAPASTSAASQAEFDRYADDYDRLCADSIAISGESREYFAQQRLRYLARRLRDLGHPAGRVIDYGCGTGAAAPFLREDLGASEVLGIDPSEQSLERARGLYGSLARFVRPDEHVPDGGADTVYVSAVFHHIVPDLRLAAARYLHASLRPGGILSVWEHNAWSPAARYVMWTCAFDADAQIVWPASARRLLKAAGFQIIDTRYWFIFPHLLRALRPLEGPLSALPLGAQYQVLCRKPVSGPA